MDYFQWDNFGTIQARWLAFDTVYANIILLWIRDSKKTRATLTPPSLCETYRHLSFCLDEISFRRDYKSCRIGVVVVVVDVPHLWKLCDGITFVILELHF